MTTRIWLTRMMKTAPILRPVFESELSILHSSDMSNHYFCSTRPTGKGNFELVWSGVELYVVLRGGPGVEQAE